MYDYAWANGHLVQVELPRFIGEQNKLLLSTP